MKDLREIWKQSKENASSILLYGAAFANIRI
jgi:hypothetical protein